MSFNHSSHQSVSVEELTKMGFVENPDPTGDGRGTTYDYKNEKFLISINAWLEVELTRLNPETDSITIQIKDKFDLERLIDFIS